MFKTDTIEDIEEYCEYVDIVSNLSIGQFSIDDVSGKHACGTCRYLLTKGAQGIRPRFHVSLLKDSADHCLVDCVLYALDENLYESDYSWSNHISELAEELRSDVICPFPNVKSSRFLPVVKVVALRMVLNTHSAAPSRNISYKTIVSRVSPVLVAKNVHVYSLSRKNRCFATSAAFSDTLHGVLSVSGTDETPLLPKERRQLLHEVSRRYISKQNHYRRGIWKLSEEIAAIPTRLWSSVILDMASVRQLAAFKVVASEKGVSIADIFRINNDDCQLPSEELDNFTLVSLKSNDQMCSITRGWFLLCLRTLKVLEQMVFSRSRLSVGPLQMTTSIAGIIESSASWTSVLHSLGIVVSYDAMQKYRKGLIAEREQAARGAFDEVKLDDRVITLQIDNFDMLPFNNVKAAGKAFPVISGTATQSIVQTRRRRFLSSFSFQALGGPTDSDMDNKWKDCREVQCMASREAFISSLNSDGDQRILEDFYDVAFCVVYENREELLGTSGSTIRYKRGNLEQAFEHKGHNFRSLL